MTDPNIRTSFAIIDIADLRRSTELGYRLDNLISEIDLCRPESPRWHKLMDSHASLVAEMRGSK